MAGHSSPPLPPQSQNLGRLHAPWVRRWCCSPTAPSPPWDPASCTHRARPRTCVKRGGRGAASPNSAPWATPSQAPTPATSSSRAARARGEGPARSTKGTASTAHGGGRGRNKEARILHDSCTACQQHQGGQGQWKGVQPDQLHRRWTALRQGKRMHQASGQSTTQQQQGQVSSEAIRGSGQHCRRAGSGADTVRRHKSSPGFSIGAEQRHRQQQEP